MIKKILGTAAAVLTATAGAVTLNTAPAHAVSYDGKITAGSGLSVRYAPSTHASKVGTLAHGKRLGLGCWVYGTPVDGNRTWYALPTDSPGTQWIAGRYVDLLGSKPPRCTGDTATGKATAALSVRKGPNTQDAKTGTVAKGATFSIICKQPGQQVDGNNRWYWTTGHGWVSARYVSNVGPAPQWCRWP